MISASLLLSSASMENSVLTPGVKRVAIEAGVGDAWYKYVGLEGDVVCMTSFGESAPITLSAKTNLLTINDKIVAFNNNITIKTTLRSVILKHIC
jgi:transketolase